MIIYLISYYYYYYKMSYVTEKTILNLVSDETVQNLICFDKVEDFFEKFNTIILSSYYNSGKQYYDLYSHIYKTYHFRNKLPFDEEYFEKLYKEYQRCLMLKRELICNFDGMIL